MAVIRVLESGGVVLTVVDRERIMSCTDLPTLDIWLSRARTATTAAEVFA